MVAHHIHHGSNLSTVSVEYCTDLCFGACYESLIITHTHPSGNQKPKASHVDCGYSHSQGISDVDSALSIGVLEAFRKQNQRQTHKDILIKTCGTLLHYRQTGSCSQVGA